MGYDWGDTTIERIIAHIVSVNEKFTSFVSLCALNGDFIGFVIAQIDEEGNPWCKRPGYGFIGEFYIDAKYRRNGYGRRMYLQTEQKLKEYGAKTIYLTSEQKTGELFWKTIGFRYTGVIYENNGLGIYEKEL